MQATCRLKLIKHNDKSNVKKKIQIKKLCSHISTQTVKTQDGKSMPPPPPKIKKEKININLTTYLYEVFDGLLILSKTFSRQQISFIFTISRVHK